MWSPHRLGTERFWRLPTAFWLDASPAAPHAGCALGTLATLTVLLGRWRCTGSVIAYACYLSLLAAGQVFLSYQWDILLIECFVVEAVMALAPRFGVWLARLALFRFMFLSGFVKLASGDPSSAPPRWATPHQPRLDWQMWFAALTTPEGAPWIYDFAFALRACGDRRQRTTA